MTRTNRMGIGGLIVAGFLGLPACASAGPYVNLIQPCDCPPNHYSAMHYITPVFYRWAAWCQGPCRYTFAKIYHPDIPPTYNVNKYHCPSVNPLQFSLDHYAGLAGSPPCSTYQSPPSEKKAAEEKKVPEQKPPELLPPPREEPEKK